MMAKCARLGEMTNHHDDDDDDDDDDGEEETREWIGDKKKGFEIISYFDRIELRERVFILFLSYALNEELP